ncbi:hypothetical protein ALC60_01565, partial [Trachymyrmex zeteki]
KKKQGGCYRNSSSRKEINSMKDDRIIDRIGYRRHKLKIIAFSYNVYYLDYFVKKHLYHTVNSEFTKSHFLVRHKR